MAITHYVLNRCFCPFYYFTHGRIFIYHGNGVTSNYTALGTKINRFHNFISHILQYLKNTIKGHFVLLIWHHIKVF